jgi:hypothetical protein
MKPEHRGTAAVSLVAFAAVCSGLALTPVSSLAAASSGFCAVKASYSGTTITWTGKGDGHNWADAANWTPKTVPDAGQVPATYQTEYVCIGEGNGAKPASVTIPGADAFHVAGIDLGQGGALTVKPGGRLFLGAATKAAVVPSLVEKTSQLKLDAAALGGNSPLTVSGTLRWTGQKISGHKDVATQTSSECAFDPSIGACPGDTSRGGGRTIIAAGGVMLVDGTAFGGVELSDGREIDNSGTITFTGFGYLAMDNGTELIDRPHSALEFDGAGGIYVGPDAGTGAAPKIKQQGAVVRDGSGTNVVAVAVPLAFGGSKPAVSVVRGSLVLAGAKAPNAPVARAGAYGVGSCQLEKLVLCKKPFATAAQPQVAMLGTSTESASPKVSAIAVSLLKAPASEKGHAVLGQAIQVTASTKKTSHSSHLTLMYDATTAGLTSSIKPVVYRGSHAVSLCKVQGLTAKNTSCVISEVVAHSGSAATKGDLTIVLITIQPDGRWLVAR